MTDLLIRVVAYIRVSDLSQLDGYSLAAQERFIREFCDLKGWVLTNIYREEGVSARYDAVSKRPVFQQLLFDAELGTFTIVIVHTLDRWSRSLKVMIETLSLLSQHNIGFLSITENLDYTTPHGKLTTQMLGGMAEFFSDMLAVHTPGVRILQCKPEHAGGIHVHTDEGSAVAELFRRYSTGSTTLSQLATYLNDEGFRTRNTKKLSNAEGELVAGPRLFTTSSVKGILHNSTYTGKVKHKDKLYPGLHEALISEELFQVVQDNLRKNSGRSETLQVKPEREYLLKGIVRCAYCKMPMSSQTYNSGNRYYREQHGSRGSGTCVNKSGSIRCETADEQMGKIMGAIVLPDSWLDRLLAKIQLADEVKRINRERKKVETRLKRLGQIYLDDLIPDDEYKRQKKMLEEQLVSLQVPGLDAVKEAGKLLEDLPKLWKRADLGERRKILTLMLEAVYIECKEEKRIVGIKPDLRDSRDKIQKWNHPNQRHR